MFAGTPWAGVECLPYIRVLAGPAELYLVKGRGLRPGKPQPYLTARKKRGFKFYQNESGIPLVTLSFSGVAPGTYYLQGAMVKYRKKYPPYEVLGSLVNIPLTVR